MNFKYLYYKFIENVTYRYNQISQKYPRFKRNAIITLACLGLILLGILIYFVYFAKEKAIEEKQEMITVKVKKAVKEDYKDTSTFSLDKILDAIRNIIFSSSTINIFLICQSPTHSLKSARNFL